MLWIALRVFGIFALIYLTYNTFSDFSYVGWLLNTEFVLNSPAGAGKILLGLLLILAWGLLIYATKQAKGLIGTVASLVLFAVIVWFLHTLTLINIDSISELFTWGQGIVAVVLSIGSFWSKLWRRFTGQVAVDDVDTN